MHPLRFMEILEFYRINLDPTTVLGWISMEIVCEGPSNPVGTLPSEIVGGGRFLNFFNGSAISQLFGRK